ncbi:MAG: hypothetical protein JWR67_2583, partial [Mucilaginibacter sp.]|nr:hypothetical protein [Mucilaginibacter sp.]
MPKLILLIHDNYSALTYSLIITLLLLTLVFFFIALFYRKRLKTIKKQGTNTNSQQLNSLLNSLNDIIFEFNEDKVCLNVWFNNTLPPVVDPNQAIGKKLSDVIGSEKAQKFNEALDHVIKYREATSLEYLSDFDTGEWFLAKMTPVFDRHGKYTSRISASLTNISRQKKYADASKENELLLIEAQTIAKVANWWYDKDTKEIYWSKNLYSILEIDPQLEHDNKFESYMKMVHPDDRENLLQYFSSFPENMEDIQYVHKLITPK